MRTQDLLSRLASMAQSFRRASSDIEAIVMRARVEDHRGVLQNARLVAETLMRDVYTREVGQPPGKKMLGDLTAQFRQSSHAGIIPSEILFFIDGVAAAGNLGAHDHAASLDDEGPQMSAAHAFAATNNLVAILEWYGRKYIPEFPVTASGNAPPSGDGRRSAASGDEKAGDSVGPAAQADEAALLAWREL